MPQFRRTHIRTAAALAAAAVTLAACSSDPEASSGEASLNVDGMSGVAQVALDTDGGAPADTPDPRLTTPEFAGKEAAAVEVYEAFLSAANESLDPDTLAVYADQAATSGVRSHQPSNIEGDDTGERVQFSSSVLAVELVDEGTSALLKDCLTVTLGDYSVTQRYDAVVESDTGDWRVTSFGFPGDFTPCIPYDIHAQVGPVATQFVSTYMDLLGPANDLTPLAELTDGDATAFVAINAGALRTSGLVYAPADYDVDAVPVAWDADLRVTTYLLCATTEGGVQVLNVNDDTVAPLNDDAAPVAMAATIAEREGKWVIAELSDPADMGLDSVVATCFTGNQHSLTFAADSPRAGA